MWNYRKMAILGMMILSMSSVARAETDGTRGTMRTVSREERARCQLEEETVEQLHEIRTERRHTKLMLEKIEGGDSQIIKNARRRLQRRLVRIEQAEEFVLSTSCGNVNKE